MSEQLLTVPEFCRRLGIKTTKAYEILKHGEVPRIKLGPGSTRVRESDLKAYIDRLANEGSRS